MGRRVVRDRFRPVDRDPTVEVLRPVDLAQVAVPPTVRSLTLNLELARMGERPTRLPLRRVLLILLEVVLTTTCRDVDRPHQLSARHDEHHLLGLVDLHHHVRCGALTHRSRRRRCQCIRGRLIHRARRVEAGPLLESHHCLLRRRSVFTIDAVQPEPQFQESLLDQRRPHSVTASHRGQRGGEH